MLCKNCGATNEDNAKFCSTCGSGLVAEETPIVAEETPVEKKTPMGESPVEESPVTEEAVAEEAVTESEVAEVNKKKSIFKKWWFWVIIGVVVIGLLFAIGAGASDSSDDDDSSSGSSSTSGSTYVNPFVTLVKTAKNSTYGITYGAAFDRFFTNPKWSYFVSTTGLNVVEFTGGFYYDNKPATATIQFVIDTDEGTLEVYHLSINGEGQSKLMLSALVKKVFESY